MLLNKKIYCKILILCVVMRESQSHLTYILLIQVILIHLGPQLVSAGWVISLWQYTYCQPLFTIWHKAVDQTIDKGFLSHHDKLQNYYIK